MHRLGGEQHEEGIGLRCLIGDEARGALFQNVGRIVALPMVEMEDGAVLVDAIVEIARAIR
jgi:hypothetical protein